MPLSHRLLHVLTRVLHTFGKILLPAFFPSSGDSRQLDNETWCQGTVAVYQQHHCHCSIVSVPLNLAILYVKPFMGWWGQSSHTNLTVSYWRNFVGSLVTGGEKLSLALFGWRGLLLLPITKLRKHWLGENSRGLQFCIISLNFLSKAGLVHIGETYM